MAREKTPTEVLTALIGELPDEARSAKFSAGGKSRYVKKGRHKGGPRRKKAGGRGRRKHIAGAETVRRLSRVRSGSDSGFRKQRLT